MSGWEASSRPNWDPQGGAEESTQSFGAADSWNTPREPQEDGGFTGTAPHGTPPEIFTRDYDSAEFASKEFAPNGFGRPGDPQGSGQWDSGPQDYSSRGYRAPDRPDRPERSQRPERPDRPERPQRPDRPERLQQSDRLDRPDRPERSQWPDQLDSRGRGYTDPPAYEDMDQAARMDPALRDFFSPQAARPGSGPQAGFGQQRQGASGYTGNGLGHGSGGGAGQDFDQGPGRGAGESRDSWAEPVSRFEDARPGGWDSEPGRHGSRSARREEASSGHSGRLALVTVCVIVIIGIAVGGYLLLFKHHPVTPSSAGPTTSPTSNPLSSPASSPKSSPSTSASPPAPPATASAYTLSTPATAGGYSKLTTIPSRVQTGAPVVAQAVENAVVREDGGKVTGQVTAVYQLSSGQALAFSGFNGTFSPAKVAASVATFGTHSNPATAGPHGGMLACYDTAGTPSGTVCVWATTTTLGVTEFFSSIGPEDVTNQAKAAQDTLKLRNSVELAK